MAVESGDIDVAATRLDRLQGRADRLQLGQDLLESERVPDRIGRNEDGLRADGVDLAEGHPDPEPALDRLRGGIGDEGSAHGG